MKDKNLIMSILSLCITCLLLVTCILAWYCVNEAVYVNDVVGSTKDLDIVDLELERGSYDSDSKKWTWEKVDELSFLNINPGNAFYFRLKLDNSTNDDIDVNIRFNGIDSLLDSNVVVNPEGTHVCLKQGEYYIPLYKIADNKVTLSKGTLYTIDSNEVLLGANYKIENVFEFYQLGTSEPGDDSLTGTPISLPNMTSVAATAIANSATYFYFALEFDNEASLENINGVDCSNAYAYQSLSISSIYVES